MPFIYIIIYIKCIHNDKPLTLSKYPWKNMAPLYALDHTTKGALTRSIFLPSTSVLSMVFLQNLVQNIINVVLKIIT